MCLAGHSGISNLEQLAYTKCFFSTNITREIYFRLKIISYKLNISFVANNNNNNNNNNENSNDSRQQEPTIY